MSSPFGPSCISTLWLSGDAFGEGRGIFFCRLTTWAEKCQEVKMIQPEG